MSVLGKSRGCTRARYEPKSGLNWLATTELAFFFSSSEVALVLLLTFL